MRRLDIPGFLKPIEIIDLEYTVRTRLSQDTVMWPLQAIPLLGYMAHPNDPDARAVLTETLEGWSVGSAVMPARIRQMQIEWARIGDIFNLHHDIKTGAHQERRGGASIGKAIALAAAQTKNRGSSEANLWQTWARYKDVAHLVAAATVVAGDALERAKVKSFGGFGLPWSQLQSFPLTMMLPDVVLSVGLYLQEYGLAHVPHSKEEPMLDPETLWRIPDDMNVTAMAPPIRKINREAIHILDQRRAGNRGGSS